MLTTPLLDGSRKGGEEPLFGVGEILNGEFKVKSFEADKFGRRSYKCVRLLDGENVLIRCEGLEERSEDTRSSYSSPKQAVSFSSNEIQSVMRSEAQVVEKSHANDAQALREEHAITLERTVFPGSGDSEAPRRREGPPGARSLVYKRGDCHLEIDIPGVNINSPLLPGHKLDCTDMVLSGGDEVVTKLQIYLLCVFLLVLYWTESAIEHMGPLRVLILAVILPGIVHGVFTALGLVRHNYLHENLIITPASFKIRRTVEFSAQYRDSVSNAAEPLGDYPLLDRLFYSQVTGPTKDLTKAKIKKLRFCYDLGRGTVVSLNGQREPALHSFLSDPEKEWLLEEINETLENIELKRCALNSKLQ